jgi:hypothetical protein
VADNKKIWNIIFIIWLVIMIALWVTFSWWTNWIWDIFIWMWIAIGWSAIGGIVGSIIYAARNKRNLVIVAIVWIVLIIFFWVHNLWPFIPGADMVQWNWITISLSIGAGIVLIGILLMKFLKKTEW